MRVYDVVKAATSEAPPPHHTVDDIIASGQRVQRRRRAGFAGAGAAALTAGAAAVALTLPYLGGHATVVAGADPSASPSTSAPAASTTPGTTPAGAAAKPPVAPAAAFNFTFKGWSAGGLKVKDPAVVSTAYQLAAVDGAVSGYFTLYNKGAFSPDGLKDTTATTVAGHPAVQTKGDEEGTFHRILAWQYDAGAWATIETYGDNANSPSPEQVKTLAAGFKQGSPSAAKVPFTFGYIPAGYQALQFGSHVMAGKDGIAGDSDGDFGGAIFAKPAPKASGLSDVWNESGGDDAVPNSFELFVVPNGNSNQALANGQKVPAAPVCIEKLCNAWTPDGQVNIQIARGAGGPSNTEITKMLKSIKLASDLHDDATWNAAANSYPAP
jgi:hypothetical protein